jgi:hypothetical protein
MVRLIERAGILQMMTVLVIVVGAGILATIGKVSAEGIISVLSESRAMFWAILNEREKQHRVGQRPANKERSGGHQAARHAETDIRL